MTWRLSCRMVINSEYERPPLPSLGKVIKEKGKVQKIKVQKIKVRVH